MKLIVTNDGVYGVQTTKTITWFYHAAEACVFGAAHSDGWLESEFILALNECAKNHHDVAEFGVNGTLMYTTETEGAVDFQH